MVLICRKSNNGNGKDEQYPEHTRCKCRQQLAQVQGFFSMPGEQLLYKGTVADVHEDHADRLKPIAARLKAEVKIDAVAQTSKVGFLYVLNRETGESLFPIEERPVPASDVPGEQACPTQPFPLKPKPYIRQLFPEDSKFL